MAHFALLNSDDEVIDVFFLSNDVLIDENGEEKEELGIQHLLHHHGDDYGADAVWVQTSFNGNFRGNYARIGGKYHRNVRTLGEDSVDVFMAPQLDPSWLIDEQQARWVSSTGEPFPEE